MNSELGSRTLRKVAWRLIPFMGLLYFLAFVDRVNIGFAALTMNADLGLTPSMFGFASGIFFIGYGSYAAALCVLAGFVAASGILVLALAPRSRALVATSEIPRP